ncbi:MAG TPA: helix-hairpin-helix domain-containing protein [Candidatus Acidoferrum sp.]|nr:helix-hairpin-helix domain-containing protein [Candidatus Acidoferrum sp.]
MPTRRGGQAAFVVADLKIGHYNSRAIASALSHPIIALYTSFWHYHAMTSCPTISARWRWLFFVSLLVVLCLPVSAFAKKKPPAHPINLNTASAAELQEVPGIGPSTAQKILDTRKSYGAFKSVDDLLAIKGIGPKRLDKMRKYLTVNKPPAKKTSNGPETAANPPKAPPAKSPAKQKAPPPAESDDEEP